MSGRKALILRALMKERRPNAVLLDALDVLRSRESRESRDAPAGAACCPFCGLTDGFHDEGTHAARACLPEKLLPWEDPPKMCRACDEPLNGPGEPGCRYPNHETESSISAPMPVAEGPE